MHRHRASSSIVAAVFVLWGIFASSGETDRQPASYPDHRHLLVFRDADGQLKPVTTPAQWAVRRGHILEGMQAVMGELDRHVLKTLPDAQETETSEGDGFTRTTLSLQVVGEQRVTAYLFVPRPLPRHEAPADAYRERQSDSAVVQQILPSPLAGEGPGVRGQRDEITKLSLAARVVRLPAVIALHPTSPLGKGVVAGLGPRPNRGYAVELAQRGYVVIAPDYPSFGDLANFDFHTASYPSGTMQAVVNHMRCIDYLCSRSDVDSQRIAAIGHSLGGHNAIFLGVFDPRVKVIVSSCGWTPFHDYYGGKLQGWAQDRYMPRIRDVYQLDPNRMPFDFYELVAALAPRAFFSNSPLHDANFAVEGVKKAVAEAQPVYKLLGAADALEVRYPDCEHDFPNDIRRAAYEFMDRQLHHAPTRAVP